MDSLTSDPMRNFPPFDTATFATPGVTLKPRPYAGGYWASLSTTRTPNPRARAQFFQWMQRSEPYAFSLLTGRPTLDGLSDSATAPAANASPEATKSWWQTLTSPETFAALTATYKDVATFRENLKRAREDKPPVDPSIGKSNVGVQVGVELDPQQRNLLILGGLGLVGLLAWSAMR